MPCMANMQHEFAGTVTATAAKLTQAVTDTIWGLLRQTLGPHGQCGTSFVCCAFKMANVYVVSHCHCLQASTWQGRTVGEQDSSKPKLYMAQCSNMHVICPH